MARGGVRRGAHIAWKGFCYTLGILVVAALAVQLWFFAQVLCGAASSPSKARSCGAHCATAREDPGAKLAHQWVPYARVSSQLKRAVVAAEDASS